MMGVHKSCSDNHDKMHTSCPGYKGPESPKPSYQDVETCTDVFFIKGFKKSSINFVSLESDSVSA